MGFLWGLRYDRAMKKTITLLAGALLVLSVAGCSSTADVGAQVNACAKSAAKQFYKMYPDTPTDETVTVAELAIKECKADQKDDPAGFAKSWG